MEDFGHRMPFHAERLGAEVSVEHVVRDEVRVGAFLMHQPSAEGA